MKNILVSVLLLSALPLSSTKKYTNESSTLPVNPEGNLIIITIDGFRWQEIFEGADPVLLNDEKYTADTAYMKMLYWDEQPAERRKKLMPFFWNVLATKGQLFGNRNLGNKMNTVNSYAKSYPGYSELFTGAADMAISSNEKINNPNLNVLEYLDSQPAFSGRIAAFTSWDVFPYILGSGRNKMIVNSAYDRPVAPTSIEQAMINKVQEEGIREKKATRFDELTFLTAREFMREHRPRLLFLGLGETDEFAHQQRYDLYLEQANKSDRMIAGLWHWVQTTTGYKDNTTMIITTDHGRGSRHSRWASHGGFIKGSSQTWLAVIGPGIHPRGEINDANQFYQAQVAQTIAELFGERMRGKSIAPALSFR